MTTEDPTAPRSSTPQEGPADAADPVTGRPGVGGAGDVLGAAAPTEPLDVPTRSLVLVGTALWAVALVVTLIVPALHTGERSWWPWACVSGIALGGFALWYVRRGRGSAADL